MLIATDVAARGIDIDDIGAVIHFDPPRRQGLPAGRDARRAGATDGRSRSSNTTSTRRWILQRALRPRPTCGRGVLGQPDAPRPAFVPRRRITPATTRRLSAAARPSRPGGSFRSRRSRRRGRAMMRRRRVLRETMLGRRVQREPGRDAGGRDRPPPLDVDDDLGRRVGLDHQPEICCTVDSGS